MQNSPVQLRRRVSSLLGALFASGSLVLLSGVGAAPAAIPAATPVVASAHADGYVMVARDGGIFAFGGAGFLGSTGGTKLNSPIVALSATSAHDGYWAVAADGGVFSFGKAGFHGSTGNVKLNSPIVAMAASPSGAGYTLVAKDGGVFTFGDAGFHGSTGGTKLNSPIVATATTPSGNGYWTLGADGGVFAFGDAAFHGSTGAMHLTSPIVGIAATPSGNGYWMVAADGGVFSFGDARFFGSSGNLHLQSPIVGMAATSSGNGYWLVAADGGVFSFGDATFEGSTGSVHLNSPIVGIAVSGAVNQPPTVTITDGASVSVTKTGSLTLTGGAVDSDGTVNAVEVSADGSTFTSTGITCSGCGTSSVTWSYSPPTVLANGTHQITFRATDDNRSASVTSTTTVLVDTLAPSLGITAGPVNGSFTASATPTFSGTAVDPGVSGIQKVTVSVDGGAFSTSGVTCSHCGTASATWSYHAGAALTDGGHTFAFRSADGAGNLSASASASVTIDTVPPAAPVVVTVPTVNIVNHASVSVSGTAEAGSSVHVTLTDAGSAHTVLASATADGSGNWTVTGVDTTTLADGSIGASATATDPAGNISVASSVHAAVKDTVAPAAPVVVTVPTVNIVNHASVSVSGTAEAGSSVHVTLTDAGSAHTVLASATADGSGNWTVTGVDTTTLADGSIGASATATDPAGNISVASSVHAAVKDTVAPAVAVTSTHTANLLNETGVSVSGTNEAGATVTVIASDGVHSTAPVTATVSGATWSATLDVSSLNDGTITYSATAVDAAANSNVSADTGTKDTLAPTFDSLTAVGGSTDVTLTFSEPVACGSVNAVGFVALVDGLPDIVVGVSCAGTSSTTLTGTLTFAPLTGQSVQVSVGVAAVSDVAGNTSLILGSHTVLAG